ncbi:hypothetical protein GCM10007907_17960 [Chitinimonas prasina]|uniref:Uncharacterized protein n=1 Tax=Chitinimonas prasina TaxID=1434937 RepID=A0ABQ5YIA2_9NEIS|nr:hypothetical protein [Chitinimonas prasina]GLR13006.1 hypothetical protein GCM10007907_17960 [Chitinimonas prasina]
MKIKLKVPKPRNPIALAASQRGGGGVHDKAEKIRRRDSRQALRQALKQGRDDVPPFLLLTCLAHRMAADGSLQRGRQL